MRREDERGFAILITGLAATFGKQAEPALIEAYYNALKDLSYQEVESAVAEAIMTCEFFPRPVNIRRLAAGGDVKAKAAEAWAKVIELAKDSSRAVHPDPVAEKTIKKLGGWRKLGQTNEDRMEWVRKEFLDVYQSTDQSQKKQLGGDRPLELVQ